MIEFNQYKSNKEEFDKSNLHFYKADIVDINGSTITHEFCDFIKIMICNKKTKKTIGSMTFFKLKTDNKDIIKQLLLNREIIKASPKQANDIINMMCEGDETKDTISEKYKGSLITGNLFIKPLYRNRGIAKNVIGHLIDILSGFSINTDKVLFVCNPIDTPSVVNEKIEKHISNLNKYNTKISNGVYYLRNKN